MVVINLFGGPCSGKSTTAYLLFGELKKLGYNVEIISEYAKKLTYKEDFKTLQNEQLHIFSHQLLDYRILNNQVDIAIAESPLLLSIIYNDINKAEDFPYFNDLILHEYNKYDNINIFINRETNYQNVGRYQSLEESKTIDENIKILLKKINYINLGLEGIVENIIKMINEKFK